MSDQFLFILACAVTNCLGGRFPKDESTLLRPELVLRGGVIGILTGLYAATQGYSPLVSTCVGLWVAAANTLWATFGWGSYFSAVTGRADPTDTEIHWIDRIGYRLFPWNGSAIRNKNRGGFQMGLRGLYQYPLFSMLAILNPWASLIGLGCVLQGVCYRLQGCFRECAASIARAELLEGALYGTLIASCLGS